MTRTEQGDTRRPCSLAVKCPEIMPSTSDCSLADHQIQKSKSAILVQRKISVTSSAASTCSSATDTNPIRGGVISFREHL